MTVIRVKIINIEMKINLLFEILIAALLDVIALLVVTEVLVPNRCWNDGLMLNI